MGNYIEPGAQSGAASLSTAKLGLDLRGWIEDPEGAESYPIATFTWLMFYKKQDAKKATVLRNLVEYCASKGQAIADSMGYIPLPPSVVEKIKAAAAEIK